MNYLLLKRVFDFLGALIILVFISTILLIIAFFIKIHDGGPIIFRQKRIGKDGREFLFLKF